MHRYDYSFLKKQIPGNILGLAEIPKGSPDWRVCPMLAGREEPLRGDGVRHHEGCQQAEQLKNVLREEVIGLMKIPVGKEFFDEIRRDHAYYVDKTELLYQLVEKTTNEVTLFTHPCRFGKTLMISMTCLWQKQANGTRRQMGFIRRCLI